MRSSQHLFGAQYIDAPSEALGMLGYSANMVSIAAVASGSPAAAAGLVKGDVIAAIDGAAIYSARQVDDLLLENANRSIELRFMRSDESRVIPVKLGTPSLVVDAAETERRLLGIQMVQTELTDTQRKEIGTKEGQLNNGIAYGGYACASELRYGDLLLGIGSTQIKTVDNISDALEKNFGQKTYKKHKAPHSSTAAKTMSKDINVQKFTEGNRQAWDASAPCHRNNVEWQHLVDGFADPQFSTLDDTISQQLIELPIQDKSIIQIGCNNGRELLSAISLGARNGLGIDQSQNFLDQAEELNNIAKKDCQFLCADIYDLPADIPRNHDVALITIGVLNWMPDLQRFFAIVSGLLSTNGRLVVYETHPILEMFDPASKDPLTPCFSYFHHGPYTSQEAIVYDGSDATPAPTSYWFGHRLSQIINACIQSGLQISQIDELPHSNREVDFDVYVDQKAQLPMCYTLVASKSG